MQPQTDYEAEVLVAVFSSDEGLAGVEDDLRQRGIDCARVSLTPGRYQLADRRLRKNARAALTWAGVGAVIGAAVGAAMVLVIFGAAVWLAVWLAVTLAGGGAVIGGLYGVQQSAGYDEDVAHWLTVAPQQHAVGLRTDTPFGAAGFGHTRDILQRAGAVAFLDVPIFEATRTAAETVRDSARGTSQAA